MAETREPQNQLGIDEFRQKGGVTLGPWASWSFRHDMKHLLFSLARYKFCAKLLAGQDRVLEVGCGDGFGAQVVLQSVGSVHGIDLEPLVLEIRDPLWAAEGLTRYTSAVHDLAAGPLPEPFDAAYSLDVIEHVPAEIEAAFLANLRRSLRPGAVLVMGTPNLEASRFASPESAVGHINLKSADALVTLLREHFQQVFLFSMNDEVVHTGYYGMAHYLLALAVGPREG